jgi:carbon-monoxide dehydrogenase small subunit
MARISVNVDGTQYVDDVEPRTLLVSYLREHLGKVGTVVGCDTSNCGACTVLMSGRVDHEHNAIKSCSMLAVQADGTTVTTIEGVATKEGLHPVQKAFHEYHALQCGFCTPGMIMSALDLLNETPDPDEAEIREALSGNLCRCTGYHNIVRAVQAAAAAMREQHRDAPDDATSRADFVRTATELAVESEAEPAPSESAPEEVRS